MSGIASEAFLMMLVAAAVGSLLGYHLTILSGRYASKLIARVDQALMNRAVIVFLVVMVPVSTGLWGIVILILALIIGYIPLNNGTGKTVLCGCLIIPSLLM